MRRKKTRKRPEARATKTKRRAQLPITPRQSWPGQNANEVVRNNVGVMSIVNLLI